jgi:hypothetical protein
MLKEFSFDEQAFFFYQLVKSVIFFKTIQYCHWSRIKSPWSNSFSQPIFYLSI